MQKHCDSSAFLHSTEKTEIRSKGEEVLLTLQIHNLLKGTNGKEYIVVADMAREPKRTAQGGWWSRFSNGPSVASREPPEDCGAEYYVRLVSSEDEKKKLVEKNPKKVGVIHRGLLITDYRELLTFPPGYEWYPYAPLADDVHHGQMLIYPYEGHGPPIERGGGPGQKWLVAAYKERQNAYSLMRHSFDELREQYNNQITKAATSKDGRPSASK